MIHFGYIDDRMVSCTFPDCVQALFTYVNGHFYVDFFFMSAGGCSLFSHLRGRVEKPASSARRVTREYLYISMNAHMILLYG